MAFALASSFMVSRIQRFDPTVDVRMHWFEVLIGTAFGLGGVVALLAALASFIDRSFITGILALCFGVTFVVYGVLHFAKGLGAEWAPRLQSGLFSWFAVPCLAFWLLAWTAERRKKRR